MKIIKYFLKNIMKLPIFLLFSIYYIILKSEIILSEDTIIVTQIDNETINLLDSNSIMQYLSNQCICDLDENICDQNCCCDSLCPQTSIVQWTNEGSCLNEKYIVREEGYNCLSSKMLVFHNKKRGISQYEDLTTNKTCYIKDNEGLSNIVDPFYSQNEELTLEQKIDLAFSIFIQNEISNQQTTILSKISENADAYIYAYSNSNIQNPFISNNNAFSVYQRGPFGECVEGKIIKFYENYQTSCFYPNGNDIIKNYLNDISFGSNVNLDITEPTSPTGEINKISFTLKMLNGIIFQAIANLEYSANEKKPLTLIVSFSNGEDSGYPLSGRDGYLQGYPLKIAFGVQENGTDFLKTYPKGYNLIGAGEDGRCLDKKESVLTANVLETDSTILFGVDFAYHCTTTVKNCDHNILRDYLFVQSITNIGYIGRFGSADYRYTKDWVIVDNSILESGVSFQEIGNICHYTRFFVLEVYVGQTGFSNDLQEYVDSARIVPVFDDIETTQKNLDFFIKVKYIKMFENNTIQKSNIPTILPRLPKDLVEPITLVEN